jgi:hypothetical protein
VRSAISRSVSPGLAFDSPNPNGAEQMMGADQWIEAGAAVQAKLNSPMLQHKESPISISDQ